MTIDEREFRRALSRFPTGVTIVTTREASGRPVGLTVNAFCSASLEPPLVLVCIDNRSEAASALAASGLYNVSVLEEGQEEISRHFARHNVSKFEGLEVASGQNGLPLVKGALAFLECRVVAAHPAGDHTIYVGLVTHLSYRDGRPLVYFGSAYRRLARESENPAS
jgi:flavin reductase (DIM6/NTAB) family NADH-FMN oxidoreductase RutF